MPDNSYQQYFEAQKAMFEEWKKYMRSTWMEGGGKSGPGLGASEAQADFWQKAEQSYKAYQALFELWQKISAGGENLDSKAAHKIYEEWSKQCFALIRGGLTPSLPGWLKDFAGKFLDNLESSSSIMGDYFKDWSAGGESLREAFFKSFGAGPKGYIDFLEAWRKNYDETFGKLLNSPAYGKDMDFWQRQKASFDKFIKYNIAVNKFYLSIFNIAQDATRQSMDDYVTLLGKGEQPKSFDEFYKYWSRLVSDSYQKVLFSEELSVLAGNMVDEMSRFKIEYDRLCELYLKYVPVPKKSDMDDLYKTVDELKKELRELKKELRGHEKP